MSGAAQFLQNRLPSGFSPPHAGQRIDSLLCLPEGYDAPGGRASARTHDRWARIERSGTATGITESHIQNHARPSEAWFEVLLRSRRSVLAPKGRLWW